MEELKFALAGFAWMIEHATNMEFASSVYKTTSMCYFPRKLKLQLRCNTRRLMWDSSLLPDWPSKCPGNRKFNRTNCHLDRPLFWALSLTHTYSKRLDIKISVITILSYVYTGISYVLKGTYRAIEACKNSNASWDIPSGIFGSVSIDPILYMAWCGSRSIKGGFPVNISRTVQPTLLEKQGKYNVFL